MKDKRRIINMLRNPDEKTLERLSSEYPQAEQSHKDKMYEKIKERMNNNDIVFIDEVSGVENYTRRHLWKMVPATVMSVALVCVAVGGGMMMLLKNNSNRMQSFEIAEETTTLNAIETTSNVITDETDAEQGNIHSDVTKDLIFSICENGRTVNFDKISYSYEVRNDYETGYYDIESGEVKVDNTQNTASETSDNTYYRNDGSIVYNCSLTEYIYNDQKAGISLNDVNVATDEFSNKKMFYIEDHDSSDNVINFESYEGKKLLENFDDWDIIGTEEYLGRKCVVINGVSAIVIYYDNPTGLEEDNDMCTCEYTITIDIETGVWMKSEIKHTDFDLAHNTFTITDIAIADDAKSPMSKDEFKQSALDGCFKCTYDENDESRPPLEPVNESDLAFLD